MPTASTPSTSNEKQPVVLRTGEETDLPFVYSSWLRSYLRHRKRDAYKAHHAVIEQLLELPQTQLVCAVDAREPFFVAGWLCYALIGEASRPVIHYVYVKELYRGLGLAWLLAAAAGVTSGAELIYTHNPKPAKYLARKVKAAEFIPVEEFLA